MSPRALIAGRVTDDTGDPLRQVTVHAESASGNDALLTFLLAGRGSTDDRGSYRISVPPGRYRIRADIENFPSEEPDEIRTDGTTAAVFPATWFPQAKSAAAVGTVEAVAGRELGGTDIHMVRPVVLTISGIVSGIPASARASVKFNALVHHGNTIYDIDTGADGSFSRTGLEPGTYYLYAETKAPDLRSAVVELNLSDTPIVNLELALRPAAALTGTLEAPPGTNTASLRVRLEPLTDDISGSRSAAVNADGTFEIKSVAPGRYQLTVRPMAEDIYLKTVRVDNADAPHGVLDLRRGAGGSVLKITASRGAARIDGRMQGKPAVSWYGAIVFLIGDGLDPNEGPDAIDPRTDPMGGYRSIGANGDGTFSFGSVPPGKYRLYALDTGSANRPQSPEAMSAAMAHLEAIEVKEGEHVTKDLKPLGSEGSDAGK
jgi:protocatechuate 3,4-dioxygenase beta subunit